MSCCNQPLSKAQQPSIADVRCDPVHQALVRDAVEVPLQVSIHHMGVAFLQKCIDLPQRVFAAPAGSKPVARVLKLLLKDRLYHPLDRRLDNPVLDRRDAQGPRFTARFGYLYPPHRLGPVLSLLQLPRQLAQVLRFMRRKSFYALPIYPR